MARIFISHSSKDNLAALAVKKWLCEYGWGEEDVFLDLHGIGAGARWKEALRDANARCEAATGLQDKVATLTRQIAFLDAERSSPAEALSDEAITGFRKAVSAALRNPTNRGYARAYVQALLSGIEVSEREIRFSGPKAAIAHSAAVFARKGELVPAIAQEWRTQEDSNL